MSVKNSLWIEKYRPDNLDLYICSEEIRRRVEEWIEKNDIPHMILAGSAGKGKSTLAKILIKNLDCDHLYLNASDENGIDTIREKVKGFASAASFKPLKVVVLEEASKLTYDAQEALKNIIEDFSAKTRFIFTTNFLEKINEPIQSRCQGNIFALNDTPKGEILQHLTTNILDVEGVEYDLKDVAKIVKYHYPDIRSMVSSLQACVQDNKFVYKEPNIDWLREILAQLVKKDKKAWYNIRQIVADYQVTDFQPAYRFFFDNLEVFANGNDSNISIILDDAMWKASVVPDKEINFASTVAKILEQIKNKVL